MAAYHASIKRAVNDTRFDPLALLYYIALLKFLLFTPLLSIIGELPQVVMAVSNQPKLLSWNFFANPVIEATWRLQ